MKNTAKFSWDFWSIIILLFYALAPIVRWADLPQHLDVYYHILTSWGFIKAGGYATWDFWQYAPAGRMHLYPPLFHTIIALLMKAGINGLFLAKILNIIMPVLFASTLRWFIKKNYSSRLAFWVLVCSSSSFSFYLSSISHFPSTLSLIFGFFALDKFLDKKSASSILLFILCFYTHIGTAWFFMAAIILFSLFKGEYKKTGFIVLLFTILLASPILFQQMRSIGYLSLEGINERFFCEFKTIEYALAFVGLFLSLKRQNRYLMFFAFFIASFVYIGYPSRLFSSEGFMSIAILAAMPLDEISERAAKWKYSLNNLPALLAVFLLIISPTLSFEAGEQNKPVRHFYYFDSVIMHGLLPDKNERVISRSIWFEKYYKPAIEVIQKNCPADEIIYSPANIIGVCLAGMSGRATANHLLREVKPVLKYDPIAGARLLIVLKYNDPEWLNRIVKKYGLEEIWENEIFDIYKNSGECPKIKIKKAIVPFIYIILLILLWSLLYIVTSVFESRA